MFSMCLNMYGFISILYDHLTNELSLHAKSVVLSVLLSVLHFCHQKTIIYNKNLTEMIIAIAGIQRTCRSCRIIVKVAFSRCVWAQRWCQVWVGRTHIDTSDQRRSSAHSVVEECQDISATQSLPYGINVLLLFHFFYAGCVCPCNRSMQTNPQLKTLNFTFMNSNNT